jgi:hypothetical protein
MCGAGGTCTHKAASTARLFSGQVPSAYRLAAPMRRVRDSNSRGARHALHRFQRCPSRHPDTLQARKASGSNARGTLAPTSG